MYAQIIILSVITGKKPLRSRIVASSASIILLNAFFETFFFKSALIIQYIALIINSIKICLLTLFILRTQCLRHILILLIIQFSCYALDAGIYSIIPFNASVNTLYFRLLMLITIRSCLLIISLILKKYINPVIADDKSKVIPTYIYVLIIFDVFIENGLVEGQNYETSNISLQADTVKKLLFLLILFTSAIIISLIVNVAYKRYYVMLNGILEEQVQNQLKHYIKMDKINTEIRQFKHDYNNHISCLLSMIKARRYEESEKYIINMSGRLPAENLIFKTGNYISDAILTEKQEEAGKNITIQFDGCIIPEINSTDLCIIMSNALDNAIEACVNIPGEKIVSVYGNYQQGFFVLIIKNPTVNNLPDTEKLPPTSKEDNTHHGFGLSNIKYTVQKYNGKTDISVKDGIFTLSITFDPKNLYQ